MATNAVFDLSVLTAWGWMRLWITATMDGLQSGGVLSGDGTIEIIAREIGSANDCVPDTADVCTVSIGNLDLSGTVDDNGHGLGALAAGGTAVWSGGNTDFDTWVTDTGSACGALITADGGRAELDLSVEVV